MNGKVNEKGFFKEPKIDAQIAKILMLQGLAQIEHAKTIALQYFLFLDALIRPTKENIFKHN